MNVAGTIRTRMTPVTDRLLTAADEIAAAPPERADFLHSVLCQVGSPRRKVDEPRFERTSGSASLLIEAGRLWDGRRWLPQPLPYGTATTRFGACLRRSGRGRSRRRSRWGTR